MNKRAERSDCSRLRFPATEEITKKVRSKATMFAGSAFRNGIDIGWG
jgi:hypothetical protein